MALTLFDKIWQSHLVREADRRTPALLYPDLQLLREVTSPQALVGFLNAQAGRPLHIDIAESRLGVPDYGAFTFPCDPFGSYCLIRGIDPLQFIPGHNEEIRRYEESHRG